MGIPLADRRERRDDVPRIPAGIAALVALAALAAPAAAAAQAPGELTLAAQNAHRDGAGRIALTRDAWRVRGVVRPYVAGQTVVVRFSRRGRLIHEQEEALRPIRGGAAGEFLTPFRSNRPGRVTVRAVHAQTPELDTLRSERVRVDVLRPQVGASGPLVRLLQRGLARLHYAVPRSGRFDAATARAVLAWRKVTGRPRLFSASADVVRGVLAGRGAFQVRYPRDGRHVEADLSRQVMALIEGRRVRRIYHISSGTPATPTVLGRYRVYRKSPGTASNGMVHSSYFIRGYAIHGYASVPTFPASHGCLRVPVPDAWSIYRWVRMGDVVRVYP